MTQIEAFVWGFLGSAAVEVVAVIQAYSGDVVVVPDRYKRIAFWVARFLLALLAGGLAIAYEINKPLLALNIGAATPLIIQALVKGLQPPEATLKVEHTKAIAAKEGGGKKGVVG